MDSAGTLKAGLSTARMFGLIGIDVQDTRPFPSHVATDSRYVQPGGAFVALEGERTDGHRYIPQALERGAGLIVVRRGKRPPAVNDLVTCVELDEPEQDLARMASAYLRLANVHEVVAVTGSVGKTTTRAALQQVLNGRFRLHSSDRSLNTRIGCTATVLAMPLDTELLLLEFGANKPGEIAELAGLFPPTSALVTQVAPVHLEGFGTVEGVLRGKMEITGSPRLRRFLYNFDNELLRSAAEEFKKARPDVDVYSVGTSAGTEGIAGPDFQIGTPLFEMRGGIPGLAFRLRKKINGSEAEPEEFGAGVWGAHLALPLSFAAAMGNVLGLSLGECSGALKNFQCLEGRGRVLSLKKLNSNGTQRFIVDDAYNANPLSMRASLETFAGLAVENKMAVLGEMREMGPEALKYHRELEPLLNRIGKIILVGELWREALGHSKLYSQCSFVPDWKAALDAVNASDWTGLLVKGSNSLGLQNIVRALYNN